MILDRGGDVFHKFYFLLNCEMTVLMSFLMYVTNITLNSTPINVFTFYGNGIV